MDARLLFCVGMTTFKLILVLAAKRSPKVTFFFLKTAWQSSNFYCRVTTKMHSMNQHSHFIFS